MKYECTFFIKLLPVSKKISESILSRRLHLLWLEFHAPLKKKHVRAWKKSQMPNQYLHVLCGVCFFGHQAIKVCVFLHSSTVVKKGRELQ